MSEDQTLRKHNHEIGDKTESQLLKVFSDMIKNNWRKQIDRKALDKHFFQINGTHCGITVFANPTAKQPGNGFELCKYEGKPLPHSWEELIVDPEVKNEAFAEQRYDFLTSKCKVKDIYDNKQKNRDKFFSLAVNFMLTFEIARRVEPKGTYPVTKEEVKSAQGIVFNPANYKKKNATPYQEMLEKLIIMFGGPDISEVDQKKAYKEIMEEGQKLLEQEIEGPKIGSDRGKRDREGKQPGNPFAKV